MKILGRFRVGWYLLSKADRKRVNVAAPDPADYVIDTYRDYPVEKVPTGRVIYSIRVGDTDIMTIYDVHNHQ